MLIGVPKEIKNHEYRVGLTPASVRELTAHGHQVLVQNDAGTAIDLTDAQYAAAGAEMVATAAEIFARAEMIVKVKEPQESEYARLRDGQILFTYLHLAPDPAQADGLLASGCAAIAYETVQLPSGKKVLCTMANTRRRHEEEPPTWGDEVFVSWESGRSASVPARPRATSSSGSAGRWSAR